MAVGLHRQKRVLAVTHASAGGNAKEPEDTTLTLLVEIWPALSLSELASISIAATKSRLARARNSFAKLLS
jgi:hypothetical protein